MLTTLHFNQFTHSNLEARYSLFPPPEINLGTMNDLPAKKCHIPEPNYLQQPLVAKLEISNSLESESLEITMPSSCIIASPYNKLLKSFHNLITGKHKKETCKYKIDAFALELNFINDDESNMFSMSTLKIELLWKKLFLFQYKNHKISLLKRTQNQIILKIEQHSVKLPTIGLSKFINHRLDGAKNSVNKFFNSMRTLTVTYLNSNHSYIFLLPVITSSIGAFSTTLVSYRQIERKKKELINFLEQKLPKPTYHKTALNFAMPTFDIKTPTQDTIPQIKRRNRKVVKLKPAFHNECVITSPMSEQNTSVNRNLEIVPTLFPELMTYPCFINNDCTFESHPEENNDDFIQSTTSHNLPTQSEQEMDLDDYCDFKFGWLGSILT